jgi:hypothetical protein
MARIRIQAPVTKRLAVAGGHSSAQITDGVTPVLRGMLSKLTRSRELMLVLGRAGEKNIREHMKIKDQKPNRRFPQKRTHFWARLRRLTALDGARTTAEMAVIATADRALAGPVFGPSGVKAKPPNKMLAIPIHVDSYGKRARSGLIKNLRVIATKAGAFLGVNLRSTAKGAGKKAGIRSGSYTKTIFYYRLVPSVDIPRDPTALPDAGKFQEALARALHLFCRTTFGTKVYKQLTSK